MDLDEIKEYQRRINNLADGNIFMWTIDKFLFEAEQMMTELGWKLHARMIWDKVTGIPAAYTVRYAHEYLLWFYRKGHLLQMAESEKGKWSTVFREKVRKHSQKPEIAYQMIEKMFPDVPKLEVYARNTRQGWDSYGNEIFTSY